MRSGFARARVDSVIYALDEFPELQKSYKHDIELVVDRLVLRPDMVSRVSQSVEQALELAGGVVQILEADSGEITTLSQRYACVDHPSEEIPELEPRLFSFNAPQGACPVCTGLGTRMEIDPDLVFNKNLTIAEGAIRPYNRLNVDNFYMKKIAAVAEAHGFSVRTPVKKLSKEALQVIMYGTGSQKYRIELAGERHYDTTYEGVIANLERRYRETDSEFMRKDIERFMRERKCTTCHGARLKPAVLAVTVNNLSIMDICNLDVENALDVVTQLKFNDEESKIVKLIIKFEIRKTSTRSLVVD